MVEKEATYKP